jgi:acetaldehyde dehydrogenase
MTTPITAVIVGSGNIGTDLLVKLGRDPLIEVVGFVGIDPESEGLRRARAMGVTATDQGVDWVFDLPDTPDIVFEATSAKVHAANAPRYADAGITAVDLTPAAVGPFVVPSVNMAEHLDAPNINMVTCGGQATVPIVAAVSRVATVPYAEIVASVSSSSAGPGTRANIDEFTETTARAVSEVGGAAEGKAIIILNPAKPPMLMRDTIFCAIEEDADRDAITASVQTMVEDVARFVPGYRLKAPPQFDDPQDAWRGHGRVTVLLEVEGRADFLPSHAGNLDIMTAAAARVGHEFARSKQGAAA